MHILIQSLSQWKGRRVSQRFFEEKGFSIHRKWQDQMVEFCAEEGSVALDRYWDEYAAEYVGAAGRCNPDARKVPLEHGYRSRYLDELAAASRLPREPFPSPPLLKCLFEYEKKIRVDNDFARSQTLRFEHLKGPEI
jgi:hypothetical protein